MIDSQQKRLEDIGGDMHPGLRRCRVGPSARQVAGSSSNEVSASLRIS
ncbi:MAG: hypothetical protein M3P47_07095 [Pseudomonadota bacterium]|nr:hypothetical protein [Pseudomonadota bacterium]